jgi:fructose-bisphosphate aldolase class II
MGSTLVPGAQILDAARVGGYAVGAFNTSNLEISQAIFEAASKAKSPVLIATSQSAIKYAGYENLRSVAEILSKEMGVPAALHLDHGTDMEVVKKCIETGWTSIMYDGSHEEFDKNIELTKSVVDLCKPKGISVEAELGRLGGIEDEIEVSEGESHLTDPDQAEEFVERSGCDSLAVAVGTSHGAYKFKGKAELAFDRLAEIAKRVEIPLVLHGASGVLPETVEKAEAYGAKLPGAAGVPDDSIKKAIGLGIAKINIDTDLRLAFLAAVREFLGENPEVFDPRKILGAGRAAMEEVVSMKIDLFGSSQKA